MASGSGADVHTRPKMVEHPDPVAKGVAYEVEVFNKGLRHERPPFTFQAGKWEELALERLSANSKAYVYGAAGMRETINKNREAFNRWSIVPRRLVKTSRFTDLRTEILGHKLGSPIAIAPVGVQRIFNPDGEIATARAAASEGIPYILSTAASASIEDVAKANGDGGQRWFQLYWPGNENNDVTASILTRAKNAGYTALFVTLDTYVLGWRPSDMDNGYNPFLRDDRIGVEIGFTDPVFQKKFKDKFGMEVHENQSAAAAAWVRTAFTGFSHGWEDIKFLQEHWDGPIVLKGIQSVEDAKMCVEVGVQGIVVSNHGGRQQDGGNSSLGVLPHIVDAVGDSLTIFFDSGIQCGADIAKALALGADCVLIGRPFVYGLALGGEDGVNHVLKALVGELELTLHLSGITSVDKQTLNRSVLVREDDLFRNVKGIIER